MKKAMVLLSGIALVLFLNGCATPGDQGESSRVRTSHLVAAEEPGPDGNWDMGLFTDAQRY